jgi:acetyl-CoA C-acetyltransferase
MTDAFVFDAIRTPRGRGKSSGSLHEVKPVNLLAGLMRDLQQRHSLDTSLVEDIVLGCVTPIGDQGAVIPKTAALAAGWDIQVAGVQINRFCASGLEAVNMAAQKVRSGWEDVVVAGGVESMSRVPMGSDGGAWAMDPQTNIRTGFVPQGIGADLIATLDGYTRDDVDQYGVNSHKKAALAQQAGRFNRSIVPVRDDNGLLILDRDETIRESTSLEGLAALKPSFEKMGGMGFDYVLIGNETAAKKLGLQPRGRILATALTGTDPTIMLTGPAPATRKALAKAGLTVADIDLFEVNEAFAAVVMRFMNELNVPAEKVNVNGGSIALGHPLGATGAMLLGTLLDELEARQLKRGLVTLCVGGGMGIATIVERL